MLRLIFVTLIITAGTIYSFGGAFHGLLFYLWNAYFRPESWVYGNSILSLRLSLIIGIYVVLRTLLGGFRLKFCAGTVLIWMFLAQAIVGCLSSEHPEVSWAFLETFVRVLIITYLLVVLLDDRRKFRLALVVIALSLGFETAKQGWAGLILTPGAKNQNPSPFLGDNNGVAMGTMMLLPILGALARTSEQRWQSLLHRFFAVGVFLRGITTYSRGGFLGAAALGAVQIWRSDRKIRAIMVALVLGGLVWTVMPADYWRRIDSIDATEEERDSSAAGRIQFWRVGWKMAQAKPLTGVGLSAYSNAFASYNDEARYQGEERAAHSVWFGVAGDLGFPGLVLFVANIIIAAWSCRRVAAVAKKRQDLRELGLYANALISSMVVFAVVASFLSAQYNEMIWHIFGLSTALNLICRQEEQKSPPLP